MMNILKRCWQNRWTRRFAWSAISLVTLYLLLCAWLNWSWGRQWTETVQMLEAEGETLDFRTLAADPVPDAENFCAIPLLKDLSLVVDNDTTKGEPAARRERLGAIKLPHDQGGKQRSLFPNVALGKAVDLKAWADLLREDGTLPMPADSGNAARDLLAGLSKYDPIVQELTAGLKRPHARWTPEWKTRELPELLNGIVLPHLMLSIDLSKTLALRSAAAARAGEPNRAHEEVLVMTRIAHANMNDAFLIVLSVGALNTKMIASSTWELCDSQSGTAQDFARLESALTALDFHRAALHGFRTEMLVNVNTMQYMERNPNDAPNVLSCSVEHPQPNVILTFIAMRSLPRGFYDGNASMLAEGEFKHFIKPLRDYGWKEALKASVEYDNWVMEMKNRIWSHPHYFMGLQFIGSYTSVIRNSIYTQSLANQAVIACALERHRIENGSYPDSLDPLKLTDGKPLPLDIMSDKPMGYRKTPDGKYALWCVGFDRKDDGGKRTLDQTQPERTKFSDENYSGDWVWDFPSSK